MRWINAKLREERGASAVMMAILIIPLIGFLAIALDVGALYAERAQLQNGADAAALAIAQDCADGTCDDPSARAAAFADQNANDGAASVLTPTFPTATSVTVTATTRVAGTNADAISHPFAALIGTSSSSVGAVATAEWGAPLAAMVTLPLAISYCEFTPALDGTLVLIRYDEERECEGPDGQPIPGGFGWIERLEDQCAAYLDLNEESMPNEPGNSYPGICDDTLTDMEGQTILVPIFDSALVTNGVDAAYHIYGFAAFTITGWKFSGGQTFPAVNIDSAAPNCNGNCRGIQGFFERWVSVEDAATELGGPNLGATIVRLID
ncbi:TadE/TadG family type IV pilus assembly protein [Homoserinimonas sp. A447]